MARIVRQPGTVSPAQLKVMLAGLQGEQAQVGWFPDAKYPNGTPVAYIASVQEFGWGPIPPRSFMRTTIAAQKQEWSRIAADGAKAVLAGNYTINSVMKALAGRAVGDIQKTISQITDPPLKAGTIAARARRSRTGAATTKPLIDTFLLYNSLTFQVVEK